MVKHTQTICRRLPTNCLSVFGHFVGLTLEGLTEGDTYSAQSVNDAALIRGQHLFEVQLLIDEIWHVRKRI